MIRRLAAPSLALAVSLLSACEARPPVAPGEGTACELTFECPAGFICESGACREVVVSEDGGRVLSDGGAVTADGGASNDGGPALVDGGVVILPDGGVLLPDGGTALPDAGVRLTFAPGAYRRCSDDLECAVFGGNCLIDLSLSRPEANGTERVSIASIDPSFAVGQGICTLPCTADPRICDSIRVDGPGGQSAPFSCQVVYAGQSPYPSPAPAFPFDTTLDATAMSRGVPFASVCRPPFEKSITHSESFCQACTQDMQCGASGACFFERASASPASGSCVEGCSATSPCGFGFTCSALPGSTNTYCLPTAGTCGRCRDSDGDLRGVGRCGPLDEPITGTDCDDTNAVAYFDAANPRHAFPQVCGASDVNCNGKSDDVEQLGGADHCGACGDTCVPRAGELANSRRQCVARTSSFACIPQCDTGWADCDGDIATGCETQLGANQIWAEDADGDGRGTPTNFQYVCAGQSPPAGWVQNRFDCNDTAPTIYGGNATLAAAPELCDGKDNNCNGVLDDVGAIFNEGTTCSSGFTGVCAPGVQRCQNPATATAAMRCVPNIDPATRANTPELCNALDDNCNGQVDEDLDYLESQGQENPNGHGAPVSCAVGGTAVGICAQGRYACTTQSNTLIDGGTRTVGSWNCSGTQAQPGDSIDDLGIDTNCDGTDGDLSNAVFVRPVEGGGGLDGNDANDGTQQRPVASLNRALALACTSTFCRDIFLEEETFTSTAAIVIPQVNGVKAVRIYGGFAATLVCDTSCALKWKRGTGRSVLERTPVRGSGAYPYGRSYAAIESASSTTISLVLDQVDVHVEAPDPSAFLQNGESAPTQIGLRCSNAGCRDLTLRNVAIEVAGGLTGGSGAAAPGSNLTAPPSDGCTKADSSNNCTTRGFVNGEWMQFSDRSDAYSDGIAGPAPASCPDGATARGGTSSAWRWDQGSGNNRGYEFSAEYGQGAWTGAAGGQGGSCVKVRGQPTPSANGTFNWPAGNGGHGGAGAGAAWSAFTPGIDSSSGLPMLRAPSPSANASPGRTGGGGGGGAGCIYHPNFFDCDCGNDIRGGGGGGGGCGGFQGNTGGHGGSAIALLFTSGPGTAQQTALSMSGAVTFRVGNGGAGGKGSKGGNGVGGAWGGGNSSRHSYTWGGTGGNGGGGGGGAGGFGGSSLGVVQWCQRTGADAANGCGMALPPALVAQPASFITVGTSGALGLGESGGAAGAKGNHLFRTEVASNNAGAPGANGVAGLSQALISFP